jgi:hypothetical protein
MPDNIPERDRITDLNDEERIRFFKAFEYSFVNRFEHREYVSLRTFLGAAFPLSFVVLLALSAVTFRIHTQLKSESYMNEEVQLRQHLRAPAGRVPQTPTKEPFPHVTSTDRAKIASVFATYLLAAAIVFSFVSAFFASRDNEDSRQRYVFDHLLRRAFHDER